MLCDPCFLSPHGHSSLACSGTEVVPAALENEPDHLSDTSLLGGDSGKVARVAYCKQLSGPMTHGGPCPPARPCLRLHGSPRPPTHLATALNSY